jgi:tripeptide aminopeptidase
MKPGAGRAAEAVDERRMVETFLALAAVNGPSGAEGAVARDLEGRLRGLGFAVEYDDAHVRLGGECGNMIARWEGTGAAATPPLFFSAHMDTVLPTAGLAPVIADGVISSDGTTILGADDRAAIAAYLEGIRAIQETGARCGPLELILTVSEQPGLLGARHLDFSRVRAQAGFVFDSSGDVGQIITRGPYSTRVRWRIEGKPAHLGLAPEDGISAIAIAADALVRMRLGRVSETTSANVGIIHGGTLASIIPDLVEMVGEVRSFSAEGLEAQLREMTGAVATAARSRKGTAQATLEKKYLGFDLPHDSAHVQVAVRAARRIGRTPYFAQTLGGADTNVFIEHGLACLTLGNGFRDIHSPREHIGIDNLVAASRYVTALVEEYTETHER